MNNIESALASAQVLADYVGQGLADNPANQNLAKGVAESLKKLIVKAFDDLSSAQPATETAPSAESMLKIKSGDKLNFTTVSAFRVADFKSGVSGKRKWNKTTFVCVADNGAELENTRYVLWEQTVLKVGDRVKAVLDSNPQNNKLRDQLLKGFTVSKVTPKGATKFNKNYDEITIKFTK